ncbi:lytic transglycosylase domain-containing protein [Jannaschia sp. S6380]|uniref:lytic transglycosylase domain-containing protein n=1 Tax=Jannaschia sp. S6380 TaxID=2926408 RepID=UPI001FF68770|nr:lytic transglycosylase domain-containing protein [Jannaschia sp. S6380]MCK0166229.1 lytic transglycosylase domain-containing protein [Jannaschia sp. S6380]
MLRFVSSISRGSRPCPATSPRRVSTAFALILGLSVVAAVVLPVWPTIAQTASPTAEDPTERAIHITDASQRFGIPEAWIRAVMHRESGGDPRAVSPKGAIGLMQIMPGTWAELRSRYRLGPDPFDAQDNIFAGTAYLREMYDRYGTVAGMLAAYNAGPARVDDLLQTGRPLPRETRAYIAAILPLIGSGAATDGPSDRPSDYRDAPIFVQRAGPPDAERPRSVDEGSSRRDTRSVTESPAPFDPKESATEASDRLFVRRDAENQR